MSDTIVSLQSLIDQLDLEKSASETVSTPADKTTQSVVDQSSAGDELEALLTKEASAQTTTEDATQMNEQHKQQGAELAGAILGMIKQAAETRDGTDVVGSNSVTDQSTAIVAAQDSDVSDTPRKEKSVTETLQAIAAKGAATGAVHPEKDGLEAVPAGETAAVTAMHTSDGRPVATTEDADLSDEHEKAAAVSQLVGEGHSFEEAITLVKQAEEALLKDEQEHIKQATVAALIEEGMDIESALDLTKQAMAVLAKEA